MKIVSGFCDIHPTSVLIPTTFETLSPFGDRNQMDTFRCSNPGCDRNYVHHLGYIDMPIGRRPDFGAFGAKLKCGWNHQIEYMALTEIDGELTWACPVHECKTIRAVQPSGAFTLSVSH